jgi:hypothetical protein
MAGRGRRFEALNASFVIRDAVGLYLGRDPAVY